MLEDGGCGGFIATMMGGTKKFARTEIAAAPNAAGTKTFISKGWMSESGICTR